VQRPWAPRWLLISRRCQPSAAPHPLVIATTDLLQRTAHGRRYKRGNTQRKGPRRGEETRNDWRLTFTTDEFIRSTRWRRAGIDARNLLSERTSVYPREGRQLHSSYTTPSSRGMAYKRMDRERLGSAAAGMEARDTRDTTYLAKSIPEWYSYRLFAETDSKTTVRRVSPEQCGPATSSPTTLANTYLKRKQSAKLSNTSIPSLSCGELSEARRHSISSAVAWSYTRPRSARRLWSIRMPVNATLQCPG
jgi:hypothetical protein